MQLIKLNTKIPKLALPLILSNITVPLLGLINTAIVGHLQHGLYLGVIGLGTMIFNFIYWAFGFIRMSSTGLIAQAAAKHESNNLNKLFTHTALLSLLIGVALLVLQVPLERIIFTLIHGSSELINLTKQYFRIRILGAPAVLLNFLFLGTFIGLQKPRFALLQMLVINGLAIILGLCFVYVLGMKTDGIALADILAQYSGLFVSTAILVKQFPQVYCFTKITIDWSIMKKLLSANRDIFVRTICLISVFSFFTLQSSRLGSEYLAANTLLMNIFYLYSFAFGGFDNIAETYVGKAVGQKNVIRLKKAMIDNFVWTLIVSVVATILLFFVGKWIIYGLSNIASVRAFSLHYLNFAIFMPMIVSLSFLFDAIAIGASLYQQMRNAMIVTFIACFITWFGLQSFGNTGLWIAFLSFFIYRAITLAPIMLKLYRGKYL